MEKQYIKENLNVKYLRKKISEMLKSFETILKYIICYLFIEYNLLYHLKEKSI